MIKELETIERKEEGALARRNHSISVERNSKDLSLNIETGRNKESIYADSTCNIDTQKFKIPNLKIFEQPPVDGLSDAMKTEKAITERVAKQKETQENKFSKQLNNE